MVIMYRYCTVYSTYSKIKFLFYMVILQKYCTGAAQHKRIAAIPTLLLRWNGRRRYRGMALSLSLRFS